MNEQFPTEYVWKNCQGSTQGYRGYPCSMWVLFHSMLAICEDKTPNVEYDAVGVLLMIRQYIDNFFSCSYCRQHFLYMTANATNEIKSNSEAVLYLWKRHNNVNARLRYDDSADPEHPKVQYPPKASCPKCYDVLDIPESDILVTYPGYNVAPISFNAPQVLSFLRVTYSSSNIRVRSLVGEGEREDESYDIEQVKSQDINNSKNPENVLKSEKNKSIVSFLNSLSNLQILIIAVVFVAVLLFKNVIIRFAKTSVYKIMYRNNKYAHMA